MAQTSTTFLESSGDWFNPANWSNGVPTANSDVVAPASSVTLDSGNVAIRSYYGGIQGKLLITGASLTTTDRDTEFGFLTLNPGASSSSVTFLHGGLVQRLTENAGTRVVVTTRTLTLSQESFVSGTIAGAGAVDLGPSAALTINPGAAITVAAFMALPHAQITLNESLTYAGRLSAANVTWAYGSDTPGSTTLTTLTVTGRDDLTNDRFITPESGSFRIVSSGRLDVGGIQATAGSESPDGSSPGEGQLSIVNTGDVIENGDLSPNGGTLQNEDSGVWRLVSGNIGLDTVGSVFRNDGRFTTEGAGGVSTIGSRFINNGIILAEGSGLRFIGGVTNDGTVRANAGDLVIESFLTGNGSIDLAHFSRVTLDGLVGPQQTVHFADLTGSLLLGAPLDFRAKITGFGRGDKIDLTSTVATTATYSQGILSLQNGAVPVGFLNIAGPFRTDSFSITSDSHAGTLISLA